MADRDVTAENAPEPTGKHAGGLLAKWKDMPTSQKWLIGLGALTLIVTAYLGLRASKSNAASASGGTMPIDGSAGAADQLSSNSGGTGSSSGGDGLGGSTPSSG